MIGFMKADLSVEERMVRGKTMKITLKQENGIDELEVVIHFKKVDDQVMQIVQKLESCNHTIIGNDNGRQYKINIYDIYYIESVDKKVFIYTKEQVFRSEQKLYQLGQELCSFDFVQVSKSCILNLDVLESIETLYNSRMCATLQNQEKIMISRTFLPNIKKALSKEEI